MTAIDHRPWVGPDYRSQPAGARLLIAGFSHHGRFSDDVEDDPDFTVRRVEQLALTGDHTFFNRIAGYVGEDPAAFWSRVAFFNTLPSTVGDDRYASGTPEQVAGVEPRVLRIIAETRPDRIFVFTTKGWDMWPNYTGRIVDGTLREPGVGKVDYGTYAHADGEALAFGFRHPQYARAADMKALVAAALAKQR